MTNSCIRKDLSLHFFVNRKSLVFFSSSFDEDPYSSFLGPKLDESIFCLPF